MSPKTKSRNMGLAKLARDTRIRSSATDEFIQRYLQSIDCPRALTVALLYEHGEHHQLVALDVVPEDYNSPEDFRNAYLATKLLSKSSFLKLDVNRDEVAMNKFYAIEAKCAETNRYFRNLPSHPNFSDVNVRLLSKARRKIAEVLGTFSAEEFVSGGRWGPGSSTLVKREEVSAFNKFRVDRGATREMYSLIGDWFHVAYPAWSPTALTLTGERAVKIQAGNTVTTVPKNAKTNRVIAIEPGLNLWFQLAIGEMVSKRLRRVGIDLTTQEFNQNGAYVASKNGDVATVDFSSASDSISIAVVEDLLPKRWFTLMNSCRSQFRGDLSPETKWNKFSSMGNGFNFPLQSLIFYACAWACLRELNISGEILVFGDDVLLPSAAYHLFSSFTAFMGFSVNLDKSYHQGYFRESCGSHYYDGVNCKPFYLKDRIRSVQHIYQAANSVRLLAHRINGNFYSCDARFRSVHRWLTKLCPKPLRFRTPIENLNSGFISNWDEARPSRARHQIEGWRYSGLVEQGVTFESDDHAILLVRLWVPSTLEENNKVPLKSRIHLRVKTGMLVKRWYDLGPWI